MNYLIALDPQERCYFRFGMEEEQGRFSPFDIGSCSAAKDRQGLKQSKS
jgi:hypothetical protein